MNQDKVKITTLYFFNDSETCLFCLLISLLGGGYFAGDIKLWSVDFEFLQYLSDLDLVSVDTCGVDMFIADFERILEALKAVVAFEFVCAIA